LCRLKDRWRFGLSAVSHQKGPSTSLAKFKTGGGATGTIRPSTSPRVPTRILKTDGSRRDTLPCPSLEGGEKEAAIGLLERLLSRV